MQTTLLGFAIAVIAALVTALVGPLFVDWTQQRALFEKHTSEWLGTPVSVGGRIDLRLLPTPRLSLRDVSIGAPGEAVAARELDVELALASLFKGELKAAEARLVGPELRIGLDGSGRLDWPDALKLAPDSLAIQSLAIDDARITLFDAGRQQTLVLERLSFQGELRSLFGPFKGDGGFVTAGERFTYRLSSGRLGEDGAARVRLGIDASPRFPGVEIDGALSLASGVPRFEGSTVFARAAVPGEKSRAGLEVWRAALKLKATPQSITIDAADLQYGPDERGLKAVGTAEVKLGKNARIDGVLSARQLDLDRALALPDASRRVPAVVLREFASLFAERFRLAIPGRIGLGVEGLVVGGATLHSLRADIASANGDGWNLETVEFRAPGAAHIRASGRLAVLGDVPSFTGPIAIEAGEARALLAWAQGAEPPAGLSGGLQLSGDLALGAQMLSVERLQARLDRHRIEGRAALAFAREGRPARIEASLRLDALDLDAAQWTAVQPLLSRHFADYQAEGSVALDIARLTLPGLQAKDVVLRVQIAPDKVELAQLSAADLGGVAVKLSGVVRPPFGAPSGSLAFELAGKSLAGLEALAASLGPDIAAGLAEAAPLLAPAKLSGTAEIATGRTGDPDAKRAMRFALAGDAGAFQVSLRSEGAGTWPAWHASDFRSNLQIDTADGPALLALLKLDQVASVAKQPARLTVSGVGAFSGEMRVEGRLASKDLDASAAGEIRFTHEQGAAGRGRISIRAANASPAIRSVAAGALKPIPVDLKTEFVSTGREWLFSKLQGSAGGAALSGELTLDRLAPMRLEGQLTTDAIDARALLAAYFGFHDGPDSRNPRTWSGEPFLAREQGLAGRVTLAAQRAKLSPSLEAREVRAALRFGPREIALEDIDARLAGGTLVGQITLRRGAEGTHSLNTRVALSGADAVGMLSAGKQGPIAGRLGLQIELEGLGRSPATLIGSLSGRGSLHLQNGRLAGLDPKAFDTVVAAVDKGLSIEGNKVRDLFASSIARGPLEVPQLDGAFTVVGGQARVGTLLARGKGADLNLSGTFDLAEGVLDARVQVAREGVLDPAVPGRPDALLALRGPLANPQVAVDASNLANWLTLRSVEREAKRLEALEAERQKVNPGSAGGAEVKDPGSPNRTEGDRAQTANRGGDTGNPGEQAKEKGPSVEPVKLDPPKSQPLNLDAPKLPEADLQNRDRSLTPGPRRGGEAPKEPKETKELKEQKDQPGLASPLRREAAKPRQAPDEQAKPRAKPDGPKLRAGGDNSRAKPGPDTIIAPERPQVRRPQLPPRERNEQGQGASRSNPLDIRPNAPSGGAPKRSSGGESREGAGQSALPLSLDRLLGR